MPNNSKKLPLTWLDDAICLPSPNFNDRPNNEISLIVIHCISLPPGKFGTKKVQEFFCNKLNQNEHPYFAKIANLKVSAHFFIERSGSLTQFVSCDKRAWHAGISNFNGRNNCNDFSIGIELEGTDCQKFDEPQYQTLANLVQILRKHYPAIKSANICAHSDIAKGRKTDPGAYFDWRKLAKMANL